MRILIVHNQLWAHYKSKLFAEIYKSLQDKETESTMMVAQIALYEASRKNMQSNDQKYNYNYPYRVLHDQSLEEVTFKQRITSLFSTYHEFKPTVLNITGYFDWAQVLLMFYARIRGVRVVLSSESSTADHKRSPVKESIKRFIVNTADACFCFGSSSAQYLQSLGVPDNKIAVRHAAVVDEEQILAHHRAASQTSVSQEPAFIYVGRLSPEKNLITLINAFIALSVLRPGHHWKLRLVGAGPMEEEISQLAAAHSNIILEGSHPWYVVPHYLAKSKVLVLPSLSEPWGLVVNEAMVCGMPVLVSEVCGCCPDLVHDGVNGFTFSPRDKHGLTERLTWFIDHPEALEKMGQASREMIQPFASAVVADEMVDTFKRLDKKY